MKRQNKSCKQRVTLEKRRRGILKKAIELTNFCNQDIMLIIYDKGDGRLVDYRSSDDITFKSLEAIEPSIYERYSTADYEKIKNDRNGLRINQGKVLLRKRPLATDIYESAALNADLFVDSEEVDTIKRLNKFLEIKLPLVEKSVSDTNGCQNILRDIQSTKEAIN